jgi:hypothetical protein
MAEDPFKGLKVSQESKDILARIAAEVNAAYRENFDAMMKTLQDLAEGQKRLQASLAILVKAIEPKLAEGLPPAVSIAFRDEAPDVATAVVLANPHAAGYTLTQAELAKQLNTSQADVSVLTRAFGLDADTFFAVRVPHGRRQTVWYRPEASARFLELLANPPQPVSDIAAATIKRVRQRLKPVLGG